MLSNAIEKVLKIYKDSLEQIDLQGDGNIHEFLFRFSGCYPLDWVLCNQSKKGGLVRGQIIEISGPENSGKTSIATICAIAVQKQKKRNQVLFLDYERKYNLSYAYQFGLSNDPSLLCYVKPSGNNPGESGFQLIEEAVKDPDCGLVIVDSFAAIQSKEEVAGELTDSNIGKTAMLQSKGIKQIVGSIQPFSPTIIIVNQIREIIGGYGPSEKTSGAKALKYHAAIRIRVSSIKKYKDAQENTVGCRIKIAGKKNQVGFNDVETECDLWFAGGFDNVSWVTDKAETLGIFKKKGSRYEYEGQTYSLAKLTELFYDEVKLKQLYIQCVEENQLQVREHLKGLQSKIGLKHRLEEQASSPPEPQ